MRQPAAGLPLEGIRVADFCWLIAGPLGTRVLSNWGAEVIRIESSTHIEQIRLGGPRPEGDTSPNVAGVFNDCNTSKLSITLNLNMPEAVEIARRIIAKCDVVTNNFTGDRMDRWGLGYDDLVRVKPDIIMATMSVMGTTGRQRNYGAYGSHLNAGAGINAISGWPDDPPIGTSSLYPDFSSNPYHLALAVLAALRHRARTGEGQFIDISQYESTASLLGPSILEYSATGRLPERRGNRSPSAAPQGVYACAGHERWVALSVTSDEEWQGLLNAADRAAQLDDPRFESRAGRREHADELDSRIEAWTRGLPAQEVMARLQRHGVPAGVVQDSRDLLEYDEHYRDRHVRFVEHPEVGIQALHGETIHISGLEPRFERAPLLGEHTEEVLSRLLGMTHAEVDELYVSRVLE